MKTPVRLKRQRIIAAYVFGWMSQIQQSVSVLHGGLATWSLCICCHCHTALHMHVLVSDEDGVLICQKLSRKRCGLKIGIFRSNRLSSLTDSSDYERIVWQTDNTELVYLVPWLHTSAYARASYREGQLHFAKIIRKKTWLSDRLPWKHQAVPSDGTGCAATGCTKSCEHWINILTSTTCQLLVQKTFSSP